MSDTKYMNSVTNLSNIFNKIKSAGTPQKFTHEFLKNSLGFKSSNDRAIIPILKQLSFISDDGVPTEKYNEYRAEKNGGVALAKGLREGWSEIFLADQTAHEKSTSQLTDIFTTVTGKSVSVSEKMAVTFKALCKLANWDLENVTETVDEETKENNLDPIKQTERINRLELRHDVHIHLPPTSDVTVYKAIFKALKDELLD